MRLPTFEQFVSGEAPPGWKIQDGYLADFCVFDNSTDEQHLEAQLDARRDLGHKNLGVIARRQHPPLLFEQILIPPGHDAGRWLAEHGPARFGSGEHLSKSERDTALLIEQHHSNEVLFRAVHWLLSGPRLPLRQEPHEKVFESFPIKGNESRPPAWRVEVRVQVRRELIEESSGRRWTVRYDDTQHGWRIAVSESPGRGLADCYREFVETATKYAPLDMAESTA